MTMKRLLVLTLMALSAASARAYDFSYTYQGKTLFYTITDSYNHCVSVDNPTNGNYYSYVSGDVVIPDSVEYNSTMYAVTNIGYSAFYICDGLTSVTIPNTVTNIGESAFSGCSGLTSVTIPNSVTSIGYQTFYCCRGLTSVTIGNSMTYIGESAFSGCIGLTSVTIPNSVTSIGNYAFYNCSGLTSVAISNSVTSIGNGAFGNCNGLTSVTIPNTVTNIGESAFYGCSGLASVTIPNSVTYIGINVFSYCTGLTSIVVEEGNTHYDSRDNCNAIIQTDLNLLVQGCNTTIIPGTVTAIGTHAFSCCSGLTSITVPNSVTNIGQYAFSNCGGLTSVTIPNSVTSIGNHAFYNCGGLTSVSIPNSVTSIGISAFNSCSGLTSVTIPNSVTSIGYSVFSNCSGLTSIYCKATIPPMLDGNIISYNYSYSPQFYVPCESISAYQNATIWSNYYSDIHGMPFDLNYTYTFLSIDDSMGTVNIGTMDCDSNITVTAMANMGYQFNGWSDGGTGNPRTFHLTSDTMVTAIFDYITYIVTGQPNNATRGIVTGSDTVYYGDTVTLTAMPNYGYYFQRWQDNNTENPRTVVVTQNKTYTAYFLPNSYTVTVHSADSSQGSVNGSGNSNYMSNRTIRAIPTTGYHFSHWSDGDSNAIRSIIVTQDTVLTAFFEINSYTLTVLPNVESLGTVTGSGTYTHGTEVPITATAAQGNRFDRWNDDNLLASRTVTMTSNLQLVAVFLPVDTLLVHDTTIIHDTTYIDVFVHDTTIVTDTVTQTEFVSVHDTTFVPMHDTTFIDVFVHDTTIVTDTLWLTEYDTLWLHDTIIIHDTVYITEEGIDGVDALNAKVYSSDGRIVVEGADGHWVTLYDVTGRVLATKQDNYSPLCFDAPASGTYMIKIGAYPARKVVVIR